MKKRVLAVYIVLLHVLAVGLVLALVRARARPAVPADRSAVVYLNAEPLLAREASGGLTLFIPGSTTAWEFAPSGGSAWTTRRSVSAPGPFYGRNLGEDVLTHTDSDGDGEWDLKVDKGGPEKRYKPSVAPWEQFY
jgi:hypothetical protein